MGAAVPEEVEELRGAIKGRVLLPGQDQDAVGEALRVWAVSPANAALPRRPSPAVIVQPRGVAAVALARLCDGSSVWSFCIQASACAPADPNTLRLACVQGRLTWRRRSSGRRHAACRWR